MSSQKFGRVLAICVFVALLVFGAWWVMRSRPPEPAAAALPAQPAAGAPAPTAPVEAPPAAPAAPAEAMLLPPELLARLVRPHSPVFGPANAPVTIVEVLDPACEACKAFAPVVEQLLFSYPEDVRVVVRYADFHPVSLQALRLLAAAEKQDVVHEVLSALFDRQQEWASHTAPNPARAWLIAHDAGLDVERAKKDALASSVDDMLNQESEDLVALKVDRTPTFFVNGKPLPTFGAQELMDLVESEVKASKSKR